MKYVVCLIFMVSITSDCEVWLGCCHVEFLLGQASIFPQCTILNQALTWVSESVWKPNTYLKLLKRVVSLIRTMRHCQERTYKKPLSR